jgi:hypothetical protein
MVLIMFHYYVSFRSLDNGRRAGSWSCGSGFPLTYLLHPKCARKENGPKPMPMVSTSEKRVYRELMTFLRDRSPVPPRPTPGPMPDPEPGPGSDPDIYPPTRPPAPEPEPDIFPPPMPEPEPMPI